MAIIIIIPASSDRVGHVAAWGFRSASQTLNYTGVTWRPCHRRSLTREVSEVGPELPRLSQAPW